MNNKKKKAFSRILRLLTFAILLVAVYFAYQYYQSNNFNNFLKKESNLYTSEFARDESVKYSNSRSYKINSTTYNDAMFTKIISVEKNQPYKITCMVKTKDVEAENGNSGVGAQIAIEGTTERSTAVSGTNDWKKLELIFNSKDRTSVEVGFRLGGYLGNAKGETWFSDFTVEEGALDESNEWKFACFIFESTDVKVDNKEVKLDVTKSDIVDIKNTINRFENACKDLSKDKMTAKCDIYNIDTPLSKLSYDNEFGYYVAPEDVEEQIKDVVSNSNYDHIFVIVRLGNDEHQNDIEINDWIGLGSMDYYGIGFSNIRLPNDSRSYMYKYNTRINTFPEEVFLHEFLHSLERTSQEYGYTIPALHDYQKYWYKEENLIGQKIWYTDYMNKDVKTSTGNIGLPEKVYTLKPAKNIDFEYSYKINEFKEPQNIIEEIRQIFSNLANKVSAMGGTS